MNLFLSIFFIFFVNLKVFSQTILELSDAKSSVTWNPATDETVTVQAEEGYQIELNVTRCDLDGESGDYVVLKNDLLGDSDEDDDYSAMMFTYSTGGTNLSYLYESNKISAEYVARNASSRFTAVFTRKGQALTTTTTEVPTTTVILPTPEDEQNVGITVYLYGASANSYRNESTHFKELRASLAQMASEYATLQNCPVNGSITSSNVLISFLEQCHITWNEYDKCISLTFAIPVNLINDGENSLWSGYQFNEEHLNLMWNTLASKNVADLGLKLYPVPNVSGIMTKRMVAISLIIVILIIFLLSARCIRRKYSQRRRRKLSDTVSIVNDSNRNSRLSLTPHYLQETPPLFGSDYPIFPGQDLNRGSTFTKPTFNHATYNDGMDENSLDIEENKVVVVADIINTETPA
ncbi:uncharacterized protein LOC132704449 [Cylas formicarius]|uniref:uncharacterized protein LOC132704449 n=1 Tax=Cylas formicarius TaxID=197179 RepID=UPI0029586E94|nr:uncharacterized protein LOC132704449 [Cylas formicarius]